MLRSSSPLFVVVVGAFAWCALVSAQPLDSNSGNWVWFNATHNTLAPPECVSCNCARFWRSAPAAAGAPETVDFSLPLLVATTTGGDDDDAAVGEPNAGASAAFAALGIDADAEYYFEATFSFSDDVSAIEVDFDATDQSPDFTLFEIGYDALRVVFRTRSQGAMLGWLDDALSCGTLSGRWRSAIGGYPFTTIRTVLYVNTGDLHSISSTDECAVADCAPAVPPSLPSGTAEPCDDPTIVPSTPIPPQPADSNWPYLLLYSLSALLACMFAVCVCVTVRKFCAVVDDDGDDEADNSISSNNNSNADASAGGELNTPLVYAEAPQLATAQMLVPFDPATHLLMDEFGNVIDPATLPVLPQFVLVAQQQ